MFEQSEWKIVASEKLRTMWRGQVVSMASLIFLLVSLVMMLAVLAANPYRIVVGGGVGFTLFLTLGSAIAMLVGGIVYLVGLYGLRNIQPEYRTAFYLELVRIVLSLVSGLAGDESLLASVLDLADTVLNQVILWLVLQATGRILGELGREDLVQRGKTVWILNLATTVAGVILVPLGMGSVLTILIAIAALIASLVAVFWYIGYLGRAADAVKESL